MKGYKETPIGMIPEEWKCIKLGSEVELIHGYQFRSDDFVKNGVPVIKIGNVIGSKLNLTELTFINANRLNDFIQYEIRNGDILMSLTGNIGRVIEVTDLPYRVVQNYRVGKFESRSKENLLKRYIKFLLSSDLVIDQLNKFANQSAQANFGKQDMDKIWVALPESIAEQSKIASILSTIDDKIDSINEQIRETKKLKQSLMQQLLTRGIGHTRFKDSPLGEIPESWEVCGIESVLKDVKGAMKIGPFGSQLKKDSMVKTGVKVYGQENIFRKNMEFGDRYITVNHFNQLRSCELRPGDFIISMMGTIGKCMVVPNDIEQGIMDSHLIRLQLNESKMAPSFMSQFFGSSILLNQVKKLAHGGIMDGLSSAIMSQIKLIKPPVSEQRKISNILDDIDWKTGILHLKKVKYEQLKKGLMQQLLTGKIRVKISN